MTQDNKPLSKEEFIKVAEFIDRYSWYRINGGRWDGYWENSGLFGNNKSSPDQLYSLYLKTKMIQDATSLERGVRK